MSSQLRSIKREIKRNPEPRKKALQALVALKALKDGNAKP